MSRGHEDFGPYAPKEVGASVVDMAELAARLGSIVTFDRRGDVARLDDFEGPLLKAEVPVVGTNSYARLDSTTARSGVQCVKLYTDEDINDSAEVALYSAPVALNKWGIAISGMVGNSNLAFYIVSQAYDGVDLRIGGIKIDNAAETISYLDSAGNYQSFDTVASLSAQLHCFDNFKLVIDHANDKYARFMLNSLEWDLSAYSIRKFASATYPHHLARFYVINLASGARYGFVDDFIFTINEP